jgi:hypothetical protein
MPAIVPDFQADTTLRSPASVLGTSPRTLGGALGWRPGAGRGLKQVGVVGECIVGQVVEAAFTYVSFSGSRKSRTTSAAASSGCRRG